MFDSYSPLANEPSIVTSRPSIEKKSALQAFVRAFFLEKSEESMSLSKHRHLPQLLSSLRTLVSRTIQSLVSCASYSNSSCGFGSWERISSLEAHVCGCFVSCFRERWRDKARRVRGSGVRHCCRFWSHGRRTAWSFACCSFIVGDCFSAE